jgi:hypothetical protein
MDDLPIGGSTCPFEDKMYYTVMVKKLLFREFEEWCKENCKGEYYAGLPNPFYWKFTNSNDAMLFKMRWL